MRQALRIFRKDARRERLLLATALALTVLMGVADAWAAAAGALTGSLAVLWTGCWLYGGASVIHQERLPGERQYWLTRPYDWRSLAAAKLLFGLVFAALPLIAVQAAALLANGVSPLRHAAAILTGSLVFSGTVGLVCGALAAVTGTLTQYLWGLLALAGFEGLAILLGGEHADWGPVAWIRSGAVTALIATAGIPVLVTQYRWRLTPVARAILAVAALCGAGLSSAHGWHGAWRIAGELSGVAQPGALRLAFDSTSRPRLGYADVPIFPAYGREGLYLPVRVSGIPEGRAIVSQRVAATVDAAGGRSWNSGWTPAGALIGTDPLSDVRFLRADGPAWQYLDLDRSFYQAEKETPSRIRVSIAVMLLGGLATGSMRGPARAGGLPLDGICETRPIPIQSSARGTRDVRNLEVLCAWPKPGPDRAYVRLGSPEASRGLLTAGPGGLPVADPSAWIRGSAPLSVRAADPEFTIETWRAAGYFELSFDVSGARLRDYVLPRVTDPQ